MKINEVEYDATADADYNVPFTVQGYRKLSFTIARNVVAVLRRSEIKVICVDGDYTLWDGESANTDVSITAAHRKFQTFLLQKVHEGYLLVLMSKNRLEDVGSVLVKDEMILEKNNFVHLEVNWRPKSVNILSVSKCLDISLHSFMFIDDSSTECEEMLRAHPQVKTLRFPSVEDLIEPFISSLWILDTVDITSEAACRTEMYRNEVSRRIEGKLPEINKSQSDCVGGYLDLLKSWKMKMLIWKSSIKELLLHSDISKRVAELLHRTNQFKLNDKFLKLEDLEDQDECFVFSLDDSYGKYGIIAVIIIDHQPQELTVKQWVMSCRALGRKVEDRLLHEITLHTVKGCTDIALHFINTGKNIPMVEFIQRRKNYQDDKTYLDTNEVHNICFDLHEIEVTSNPSLLMLSVIKTQGNQLPYIDTLQCNVSQRFEKLRRWIENNLSSLHREHLCHNHVLPSYLLQNNYDIPVYKKIERKSNNALEEIWMGVLQTQKQPDINDSFVKSGGNSFQAVFLISKIMSSFGVKLELVDVLTQPYNWINREIKSRVTNKETVYNGKAYTQTMELSQAQKRMWLMQSSLKESTAYTETIAVQIGPKRPVHEIVCLLTENHPLLMARLDTSITHLSIGRSTTTVDERYFDNMHDLIQELSRSKPVFAQPDKALSKFLSFTCGAINVLVIHVHHMLVDDITLHNITTSLIRLAKSEGRDIQTHNRLHEQIESSQRCVRLEREYIESATFMQDKHFWETTFADCPEETSLGLKHISDTNEFVPKTAETSTLDIPADIHQQITNKCHAYGVTEFQYILACYVLVAQRYTAKEDILLAVPVSNRDSGNITIDGLIVNTILFRHKVNMEHTLEEHIKCVAENWLCSYSHSKYPVNFVGQIILERFGKSLSSICNQMFNFATFEQQETEIKVDSKHAKMPFSIDVVKTKNGLRLVSEYATDLINGKTVENLMGSMLNILTMDQYMAKVRDIEILMKYELQELGVFSKSHRLPPENTHVFEMFLRNVETTAESTALVFRERKTTYRELNNCVCAIASRILQKSTPMMLRTKPCLVHMDKSDNAVAAMLAVWKVGGFFMPMSTLYSSQLSDIIMAVNPGVVLIGNSFDSLKTGQVDCDIINIETVEISTTTQVTECPTLLDMDRTAYVIRTSGSTGKPKEISINHKGLAILASAWTHEYQMSYLNVNLLQWAPLSFDVFIGDIVRGLCCSAGKVVLCPDNKRLDTHYLVSLIMSEKITIAEVTPQFGLMLTQKAENGQLDSLKVFILGSDTLQKEVYTKVKRILKPPQRVLNSYGMTEATIDSAYFEGDDIPSTRGGNVPIGKPLPGVVMKVLDPLSLRPCPVGVIGELFIGGDVIGTGEVTTIEMQDGEKLLKTNDYACWLYSGDIELCGRKDTMCKLRGFRIDCAHIENAILKNCANVVDVSVSILTENVKGQENEHLCAYIVKSEKCTANTDIPRLVKAKIQDKLPYYMVPDFIECIEAIPLTNNGKVDRKKLPGLRELYQKRIDFRKQVRVENPIADVLRQLFAESLGLESTFIDDERTFMEQGGHSLILMTFSSMINERTDLNVTIVDVFSYPSINLLAEKAAGPRPEIIDQKNDARKKDQTLFDIAICGVGIRLPKNTRSIGEFWELLEKQVDLVSDFPQTRKEDVLNCSDSELSNTLQESDVYRGLFLEEIDKFDNEAFNIPSTEAQAMSPEQRLFLEVASETLAQGTNIAEISGSNIGVFVSQAEIGYAKLSHPDEATSISGLMPGMIATRVAYNYNLKGPAMLVDTACSSGITALKAACSSIEKGECKAAIVGGMNVVLFPARTGVHGNNGIMSPDFKCRPFDKKANGTAVGEGVLCFYLEPLQEALKQNKHVYAVIKSIGINNVGTGNGITAPTAQSQEDAIRSSLYQANISPQDISFIETHGTGTVLGDKIELSALSAIFNTGDTKRKLPIGSVKSNLGHLDSAAGLAGLLKIIAGYMFETIPPTKNFENPHTELTGSTLYVPVNSEPWLSSINIPRVAGVSSFGLTGTNTHMIVSDSVKKSARPVPAQVIPLLLCGATYDHIRRQAASYGKLIHQTVVKRSINTIQDITVTVLAKLGQLQKSGLLHTKHRVAILDCDAQKMSNSLDWVRSCENEIQLNNVTYKSRILYRNDSFQCKDNSFTDDTSLCINEFLTYSFIDKIESFAGANIDPDFCAPGLTIPIFDSKRHWLQPSMKGNRGCYGLIDILHRNISKTRELVRTLKLSPSPTLLEYEARFCCSIILNLLKATGLKDAIDNQQDITLESSLEKTGMLQKYDKLFFIMIRELLNSNFVIPKGSDTQKLNLDIYAFRCRDIILPSPKQIAEEAMTKYAQWADCFKFPLHCSTHLKEVLWGQMSPLSVIYPQGDLNFMYQFDKLGDLLGDVYYNMYMQIIVEYAARLSRKGKTVRILEVGAGMGHVTRQLLPSLSEIPNIEYWFTDLGRAFVENAKTLFEKYVSMMRFSTFDITKNSVQQGLLGTYDIIISYNVIHTTESIYKSVNNLRTCLGEDGTLFIIESAKNETWATLAWGILDGWWYFKDYDLRPYEPMLEPEKWREVLKNSGFRSIHSCPMAEEEISHVEKFLFVCSNKKKDAEYIPAPTDGWWKTIDLTAHRHADFDMESSCSDESGLGEEGKVSRSLVKSELKRIWCELLDLEDINDDEDFNALGGESLLAIQMMTMVRKRIGYALEIADTFCYTSLGSLGDYISDRLEAEVSQQSNSGSSTSSSDNELQQQIGKSATMCKLMTGATGHLLMFPGQGSQKVGMCKTMENCEAAREVFMKAEDILGYNILDICIGPENILREKLKSTEFVQVALFVSCLAKISQIQLDEPEVLKGVTHVAGLSVGEFAALVYAKVLKFEDALMLVQQRGRAMEKEVAKASTAMASVLGPSKSKLEHFLNVNIPNAVISTCLADNQHTVAGTESDIINLVEMLSQSHQDSLSVMDVRRLRVAGGFHSRFMVDAEKEIMPLIENCTFSKPKLALIMNITGKISDDPAAIKTMVSRQIIEPVQWKDTMITAHEAGVRRFTEIAPARVLSSIVRTRIEKCRGCTSDLIQV